MNQEIKKINDNITELGITRTILESRKCEKCWQKFTKEEIDDSNFTLFFFSDEDANKWEKDNDRLILKIAQVSHQKNNDWYDCPETENCELCGKKFLEKDVKKGIGEEDIYYCFPCYDKKFGEYLQERAKKKNLKPEEKEVMKVVQKAITEHLKSNYHSGGLGGYSKCVGSECKGYQQILESYGYEREK